MQNKESGQLKTPVPAAMYLRMSTEHQKYSLEYQSAAIQRYADNHGFKIVQRYEDPGKSGLTLKRREGLTRLLGDVTSGSHQYKAVLVYDVSRWGRFQDIDESAYYEFICKSARAPVHYCAEPFRNSTSLHALLMKTLKRIMAAEYSREVSVRLRRTKRLLTLQGFRAGGQAGYGLRRMLVSFDGTRQRQLAPGERAIGVGRVILVPGPAEEVARVREIYRLRISEGKPAKVIAREFNRKHIKGGPWTGVRILDILRNPKYMGCAAWRRTTGPLDGKRMDVPPERWILSPTAFEPIVDKQTFDIAQKVMESRTCLKSNEELLNSLRMLLKRKGQLSQQIIDTSHQTPVSSTYQHRFGTLRQAYSLIGYPEFANLQGNVKMRRRLYSLRRVLLGRIKRLFSDEISIVQERHFRRRVVRFKDGLNISILICQCVGLGNGNFRWVVRRKRFDNQYMTLVCMCDANNRSIRDFYLVPSIDKDCKVEFRIKANDQWFKRGKRITNLSKLRQVAHRLLAVQPTESMPSSSTR